MSSVDLKWVLLIELVNSGKRKHIVQDLVNAELVEALVFVFQLKTGGPKVLCAPLCFVYCKILCAPLCFVTAKVVCAPLCSITAKELCAPLCFVTAKGNSDFTTLIF